MLIDVHAHYEGGNLSECFEKAKAAGVEKIINAATDYDTCVKCLGISHTYENIYCVLGIHPEFAYIDGAGGACENAADADADAADTGDARGAFEAALRYIESAARSDRKVVGIGETGLDYHYLPKGDAEKCALIKDAQKNNFISHIKLSEKLGLPLVVHDRDAHADTLSLLRENVSGNVESVLHCYSGSAEMVKDFTALNFSFSVGGVLTFKNAQRLAEAVRIMPKERILLETDCPYLAPEPFRGKPNDSSLMVYTARRLAEIMEVSYDEICRLTTENAMRVFGRLH